MKAQALALVPRAQLDRAPRTRAGRKGRLTEWAFTGVPRVTDWELAPDGGLRFFQILLPFDVPAKPRTTQRSVWRPNYQNYLNWRRIFRSGIARALEDAGIAMPAGEVSLFGPLIGDDPWVKGARNSFVPPISVRLLINTKRQGDTDNRTKSVLDAGNAFLWPDDRMVASEGCTLLRDAWPDPFCAMLCTRLPEEDRLPLALRQSGLLLSPGLLDDLGPSADKTPRKGRSRRVQS